MKSRLVCVVSLAAALFLAGCASEDQPPAATAASAVETPSESESTGDQSAARNTVVLANHYLTAICETNVYREVRAAAYLLALQDRTDAKVVSTFALEDSALFRKSATSLLSPPQPWPSDVEPLIAQRAANLNEVSDLLQTLSSVNEPNQAIQLWDALIESNDSIDRVTDQIREKLDIDTNASCPENTNESAVSALNSLKSQSSGNAVLDCYGVSDSDDRYFEGMARYWLATEEGWRADVCEVEIQDFNPEGLSEAERQAIELISGKKKRSAADLESYYEILVESCVNSFDGGFGDMKSSEAVLLFCPRNPERKAIKAWADGKIIEDDGDYDIGVEISAGTWRSNYKVNDCYWERTGPQGNTLANDFITNSSKPITVTLKSSDGSFTTEGCGSWERIN